jgi:2'-5' RNA ligase
MNLPLTVSQQQWDTMPTLLLNWSVQSSKVMRLFIALELPESVTTALAAVQRRLQRGGSHPVKWVAPESMHLTLQFLGSVDEAQVPDILSAVQQVQKQYQHTLPRLKLATAGAFPNLRRPQTLWVGVAGEVERLEQLQRSVVNGLAPLGFAPEQRPFRAHLTLGRVRRDAVPEQQRALGAALTALPNPEPVSWVAPPPALIQSTLTRTGAIYKRIEYVT